MNIKRKFNPGTFIGLCVLHILAGYAIYRGFVHGYSMLAWVTFIGFWVPVALLGTSIGSHRYFTHASFKCGVTMQYLMAGLHGMAFQGPLLTWTLNHRQHHYPKYTDQPGKDPHTPYEYSGSILQNIKGFLWAHMAWTWHDVVEPEGYKSSIRIKNHPVILWEKRRHLLFSVLSLLLPFLIAGWDGLWLAGILRVVLYLHATWCVNSVCHMFGQKPRYANGEFINDNESRNFPPLSIPTMGETRHGDHHAFPTAAFFSWKWWHIEPGKWTLIVLEYLGIVWSVTRPNDAFVNRVNNSN